MSEVFFQMGKKFQIMGSYVATSDKDKSTVSAKRLELAQIW